MAWLAQGASKHNLEPRMTGRPLTSFFCYHDIDKCSSVHANYEMTGDVANDSVMLSDVIRSMALSSADAVLVQEQATHSPFVEPINNGTDHTIKGYRRRP